MRPFTDLLENVQLEPSLRILSVNRSAISLECAAPDIAKGFRDSLHDLVVKNEILPAMAAIFFAIGVVFVEQLDVSSQCRAVEVAWVLEELKGRERKSFQRSYLISKITAN